MTMMKRQIFNQSDKSNEQSSASKSNKTSKYFQHKSLRDNWINFSQDVHNLKLPFHLVINR